MDISTIKSIVNMLRCRCLHRTRVSFLRKTSDLSGQAVQVQNFRLPDREGLCFPKKCHEKTANRSFSRCFKVVDLCKWNIQQLRNQHQSWGVVDSFGWRVLEMPKFLGNFLGRVRIHSTGARQHLWDMFVRIISHRLMKALLILKLPYQLCHKIRFY